MSSAIGSVGAFTASQSLYGTSDDRTNARKTNGMPPEQPDPSKMFSKIDTDGDGKVSKSELEAFQKMMQKHAPKADGSNAPAMPDASQMLSSMDTDGDGNVSEAEFTTFMKNMHDQADSMRAQSQPYTGEGKQAANVQSALFDVRA